MICNWRKTTYAKISYMIVEKGINIYLSEKNVDGNRMHF